MNSPSTKGYQHDHEILSMDTKVAMGVNVGVGIGLVIVVAVGITICFRRRSSKRLRHQRQVERDGLSSPDRSTYLDNALQSLRENVESSQRQSVQEMATYGHQLSTITELPSENDLQKGYDVFRAELQAKETEDTHQ